MNEISEYRRFHKIGFMGKSRKNPILTLCALAAFLCFACDDKDDDLGSRKGAVNPDDPCTNGDKLCEDQHAYVCTNERWGEGTYCPDGCDNDECKYDCSFAAQKCEDNKAYICSLTRKWGKGTDCVSGCDGDHCACPESCTLGCYSDGSCKTACPAECPYDCDASGACNDCLLGYDNEGHCLNVGNDNDFWCSFWLDNEVTKDPDGGCSSIPCSSGEEGRIVLTCGNTPYTNDLIFQHDGIRKFQCRKQADGSYRYEVLNDGFELCPASGDNAPSGYMEYFCKEEWYQEMLTDSYTITGFEWHIRGDGDCKSTPGFLADGLTYCKKENNKELLYYSVSGAYQWEECQYGCKTNKNGKSFCVHDSSKCPNCEYGCYEDGKCVCDPDCSGSCASDGTCP